MANDDRTWQPVHLDPAYAPPKGAYSPAVRAGAFLFVSGQVPTDIATGEIVPGDVAAQSRLVLGKLSAVLEAGGATLDDVVAVTVYLANVGDWSTFNEIYRATFRPPYPARTVVGAELRGVLVEVSAIAVVRGSGAGGLAVREASLRTEEGA
jgi:reactive intermediate/imine deaminase